MGTEMPSEATVLPEEIAAPLESGDWMARREGVDRVADLLKTAPAPDVVAAVAGRLDQLAGDPIWDVRRSVAFALQHLHHTFFDRIISRLTDDQNSYVRSTAENTLKRRRRVIRAAEQREEDLDSVVARINRLRARHPAELVNQAVDIGRAYYEVSAATATHDILSVLTALRELLKTHRKELEKRKVPKVAWLDHLENADRRCLAIESIAQGMKMFADQTPPVFHREYVLAMVQEAVGIARDRLKADPNAPHVREDISIEKHIMIDAPRQKLVQVLTNIVRNAFEAIEGQGVVSITGKVNDSNHLVLRFTDNGCGIAREDIDAILLPGVSTKKKKEKTIDCSGYGLAIVQKIIEVECNGQLRIESEEGTGTTVTVILPVEQERNGTDR